MIFLKHDKVCEPCFYGQWHGFEQKDLGGVLRVSIVHAKTRESTHKDDYLKGRRCQVLPMHVER